MSRNCGYDKIQEFLPGISLTVEFADGVGETGVQFTYPRLFFCYDSLICPQI